MVKEIRELPYPLMANPEDEQVIAAADFVGKHFPDNEVYYYHPLFIWRLNGGVKDTGTHYHQRSFANNPQYILELKPGSLIIRDPHFAAVEMGFKRAVIDSCDNKLNLIKRFPMKMQYQYADNEPSEVVVYQVR